MRRKTKTCVFSLALALTLAESPASAQQQLPYVPAALRHEFTGAYFTDMNHGYVFGEDSFIATDDGGTTWRLVPKVRRKPILFLDRQTFWFFAPDGALSRTTDGGTTFASFGDPTYLDLEHQQRLPICPPLFFLTVSDGWSMCGDSVLRTSDGGQTWTATLRPPALRGVYTSVRMFDPQNGIAIGSSDLTIRTTDGGRTWAPIPNAPKLDDLSCTPTGFCAGVRGFHGPVLVSSDQGQTWRDTQIPLQLPDRDEIYSMQAIAPTAVVVAGDDTGLTWNDLAPYIGKRTPVPTFAPQLALLLSWNGATWTRISHSELRNIAGVSFVNSTDGWIIGYGDNVVFKTTDGGQTLQFVPDYFRQIAALTPTPAPFVFPTPTP